jgi:3-methyl-2-oxobutanoate hydroxymethyltransferase
MLVIEKVPAEISQIITDRLAIPTIGIGSGSHCDGQVLVVNDILGITPFAFKHAKKYCDYHASTLQAICNYKTEVESGSFPASGHSSRMQESELAAVQAWLTRQRK